MLTPLDIHNKEFRKVFRGYSEDEVDEFLDEVVRDFDNLLKENARLQEELQQLQEKVDNYKRIEETLNNTLVMAQETAEETKESARREAELILQEARAKAERIVAESRERVEKLTQEFDELKTEMKLFRTRMKTVIRAHLELLEEDSPEDAVQDRAVPINRVVDG